ncbi:chitinase [Sphingomonas oleivorans]|uniref:Chitinase n=1 Tax=Sphingomonas oleivorans TaxID=1735121 RepID=A0A2T5G3A8_9SPHN|nr:glycoside hydrolase family 19 protein [Sphingomonas oleivorans]PTQ13719.1 chitinase [Sphingomonas oleivorans]
MIRSEPRVPLSPIDWKNVQTRLGVVPDGIPGPNSYAALFAYAADRLPDDAIRALGRSAAILFPAFDMTTPVRVAEFVAQIANETGGFRIFEERLDYSAEAIRRTWPSRFTSLAEAQPFARNPQKLANRVYARPSEGNSEPGDGWRYRGRGALQLTFKNNYRAAGERIGVDLVAHPEKAAEPAMSLLIALDFWRRGKVNEAVDRGDYREARRITNGGSIGLEHVAKLREKLLRVLA